MRALLVLALIAALCGILVAGPKSKATPTGKPVTSTTTTTTITTTAKKPRPTPKLTVPPALSFCKALWSFTNPCAEIKATLNQQVKVFSPNAGCGDCNYLFVSADNATLLVDHSSSDGFKAETITFKFTPTPMADGCKMFVQSQSLGPHSTLDTAVNYCNIYNLLTGSGLDLQPGFLDKTNKWVCPGFALTECTM